MFDFILWVVFIFEMYFGVGKVVNYGGGVYDEGLVVFDYLFSLVVNSFVLCGWWVLDY